MNDDPSLFQLTNNKLCNNSYQVNHYINKFYKKPRHYIFRNGRILCNDDIEGIFFKKCYALFSH